MRRMLAFVLGAGLISVVVAPWPELTAFAAGALLGFVFGLAMAPLLGMKRVAARSAALVRYHFLFLWEVLKASVAVAGVILLAPRKRLRPGLFQLEVAGLSEIEIFLLANSITLTPGTTTIDVQRTDGTLIVHALDCDDPAQLREQIDRRLKARILAFTRP